MVYEKHSLHLQKSRVSSIGDPVEDDNHRAFYKIPAVLLLPQDPAARCLQSTSCTKLAQSSLLSPEADSVTCCKAAVKVSRVML